MYHCLSTIRAIGHRDGSPSVTAQETGQSGQPQEAEEAPFAGAVIPRRCLSWQRLPCPPWGRSWGGRAWGRLRQHHCGRHDRHDGHQEYDNSPHGSLAGWECHSLLSIHIVHTGYGRLHAARALLKKRSGPKKAWVVSKVFHICAWSFRLLVIAVHLAARRHLDQPETGGIQHRESIF
jgi:hypothetical protein